MGIFNFFKKKQAVDSSSEDYSSSSADSVTSNGNDADAFQYQINALIPRYFCLPNAKDKKLEFKDDSGGQFISQ